MDLWHCGFELGDLEGDGQYQDMWGNTHAYDTPYLDKDKGDDVVSGRYAIKLSPAGFGDYVQCTGQRYEKSGNIIYWRIRVKADAPNSVSSTDIYWVAKFGQDLVAGGSPGKLTLGYAVATVGPVVVLWTLYELVGGVMTARIQDSSNTTFPSPWTWFVVKANSSTGVIELFKDDVSLGTYTLSSPTNIEYKASVLPGNAFAGGKGSAQSTKVYVDDVGANDDASPGPSGQVLSADGYINAYAPQSDDSGNNTWVPFAGGEHFEEINDANAICNTGIGTLTTSASGNRQAFGFQPIQSGTVQAVRIIGTTSGAPDVIARTSGSYVQYAPTAGKACQHLQKTPEGTNWSNALFATLQAGWHSNSSDVGKQLYATVIGTGMSRPPKSVGACIFPAYDHVDHIPFRAFKKGRASMLTRQRLDPDEGEWMALFPPAPPVVLGRKRALLGVGS